MSQCVCLFLSDSAQSVCLDAEAEVLCSNRSVAVQRPFGVLLCELQQQQQQEPWSAQWGSAGVCV